MTTRKVTAELKRQLTPVLREWGFDVKGRNATRTDGPVTVTVQVKSITPKFAAVTGLPVGSFHADIGLDHGHATGESFLEAETLDHDQTRLQAHLSRTTALGGSTRPDIWTVSSDDDVVTAVHDVVEAFRVQGSAFIEEWSNADIAYERLTTIQTNSLDGALGHPALTLPGNPGSVTRLTALAALAAERGDRSAELQHLADLQHPTIPIPSIQQRIHELERAR